MRFDWLANGGLVVITLVAGAIVLEPSLSVYRAPLVVGLVALAIALYYARAVVRGLREDPDEARAAHIVRNRLPGWQNIPRDLRAQFEAEDEAAHRSSRSV